MGSGENAPFVGKVKKTPGIKFGSPTACPHARSRAHARAHDACPGALWCPTNRDGRIFGRNGWIDRMAEHRADAPRRYTHGVSRGAFEGTHADARHGPRYSRYGWPSWLCARAGFVCVCERARVGAFARGVSACGHACGRVHTRMQVCVCARAHVCDKALGAAGATSDQVGANWLSQSAPPESDVDIC